MCKGPEAHDGEWHILGSARSPEWLGRGDMHRTSRLEGHTGQIISFLSLQTMGSLIRVTSHTIRPLYLSEILFHPMGDGNGNILAHLSPANYTYLV